ncbi:NFACT RNA binding domain-containing protein [Peredibacter sp. HCB2-198]|uniref:NFACT RNA binding domain-containing protein n=1 Tax=Peredibacter sp. HCB2-198 TaxID=3383025 RepID=UPI0038B4EB81
MIQYYLDLEKQVKNIKEKALSQGQIQKIYSTAYFISLSIRAPGKTWHLFFGRGGGQEGLWLHDSPPPSELRRKDNFLEYLRRHLSSCSFLDVSLDKFDRIVKISYQKFGEEQSFLLFWKGRKLYFLHHYQDQPETPFKLLLSWRGKAFVPGLEIDDLYSYFDEIGRHHDMKHDMASAGIPGMEKLLEDELKTSALKGMNSAPTFLQRKKENIEDDLRRTRQWEKLQTILDKGESLDMYELKVGDHKIKFEGELNPYERRNLLFQKIKKLKRGETILSERLQSVTEQLAGTKTTVTKTSTIPITRPVWGEEKSPTFQPPKNSADEYKILSLENCQIGVGLNSQGNDQLRNKWAGKEDYWIHLDGQKSSHVVIKLPQGHALDPQILNLGASIVAHFSHFNADWIPIIYTQVKNLKGVSGAAGMVIYKKEKHLQCPRVNLDQVIKD